MSRVTVPRAAHRLPPSSCVAVDGVRICRGEAGSAHVKEGVKVLISFMSPWKEKKKKKRTGRYLETLSKGASDAQFVFDVRSLFL